MMKANRHIALSIFVFLGVYDVTSQVFKCNTPNDAFYRSNGSVQDTDESLYIPVIFHVVFNTEEQNIAFSQIQSQLTILNQDFNQTNPDWTSTIEEFNDRVANCKITFYLQSSENVPNGIRRVSTDHGPFVNSDVHYDDHGGSSAFISDNVLNIWVADLGGDVFGYSQSEPTYTAAESGVVIDYEHFGTLGTSKPPYNGGRTLTHEIGHWLGLSHPWGNGGCENDDGIADTPDQVGAIYQCDLIHSSCGSLDAVQNFMNLTPDACMTFFSSGQKTFMRQYLLEEKPDLIRSKPVLAANEFVRPVVYPNPAHKEIFISSMSLESEVTMWDLAGASISLNINEVKPNLIKVSPRFERAGSFIIRIDNNGLIYSQKIILTN